MVLSNKKLFFLIILCVNAYWARLTCVEQADSQDVGQECAQELDKQITALFCFGESKTPEAGQVEVQKTGQAGDQEAGQVSDEEFGRQLAALLNDPKYQEYVQNKDGAFSGAKSSDGQSSGQNTGQQCPGISSGGQAGKQNFDFYVDYIKKYYPKVFVIREQFFENMTPDQIALALEDIVKVFTEQPWFYFVDKQGQISVPHYWEYILDQLSLISEFLRIAQVDVNTKQVSVPEHSKSSFYMNYMSYLYGSSKKTNNTQSLLTYLEKNGKLVVYDFYALSFDYVIKLFNEAILLKELKSAKRCFKDLEYILKKLSNSLYEQDYQEVLKTCKELMASLKTKCGVDDVSQLEELFGDDAEGKQIAKETAELGLL